MPIQLLYLGWLVFYLLIVLGIGVWGWENVNDQADFATANQSLSLPVALGTLFATFMSALTVIGGVGYASRYGWAFMTLYTVGALAGMLFLTLTAKKWQNMRVNSLPEMLKVRYDSNLLRALTAVIIVFTYAIILVGELYGIGFIIEGIIGIPMSVGIVVIGLIFVGYTILGGMHSVARTDLIQAGVMGLGVLIMAVAVISRLRSDPAHSLTEMQALNDVYGGQTPDNLGVFALFLVFGLGIAIHPFYIQRVLSAKDVKTARLMTSLNSLAVIVFYLLITIIGIGGAIYLPEQTGDTVAPAILTELVGGVLGAVAMMAILAGVQSTTDSLLHIVGVYLSNDIYNVYLTDDASDEQLLRWSRIFTGFFGIIVVAITTYQTLAGEITLIVVVGAYAWGLLGGSLFMATAAGMFWKRATAEGAIAAVVLGFSGAIIGAILVQQGILPFHEIILAAILSVFGLVVVSLATDPVDDEHLEVIFPDVSDDVAASED